MQADNAILVFCNDKATRCNLLSYNVYKEKCLFMFTLSETRADKLQFPWNLLHQHWPNQCILNSAYKETVKKNCQNNVYTLALYFPLKKHTQYVPPLCLHR